VVPRNLGSLESGGFSRVRGMKTRPGPSCQSWISAGGVQGGGGSQSPLPVGCAGKRVCRWFEECGFLPRPGPSGFSCPALERHRRQRTPLVKTFPREPDLRCPRPVACARCLICAKASSVGRPTGSTQAGATELLGLHQRQCVPHLAPASNRRRSLHWDALSDRDLLPIGRSGQDGPPICGHASPIRYWSCAWPCALPSGRS